MAAYILKRTVLIYLSILLSCSFGFPTDDEDLIQELTNHRLDLLENGFKVFANEVLPKLEKVQKKLEFVTKTSKDISNQLQDVSTLDSALADTIEQQSTDIADLLWAVGDLKNHGLTNTDKDVLSRMEWTLFDLKYSTSMVMEEMCRKDITCGDWSEWSMCSVNCGNGESLRSRECSNDGKFKLHCEPILSESRKCSGSKCILNALSKLDCPEAYVSYQGYCLRFSGRRDSRLMSNIICETDDAHLVAIDSPDKLGIVMSYLEEFAPTHMRKTDKYSDSKGYSNFDYLDDDNLVAIDGSKHKNMNDYYNWEGEVMKFFHWAPEQPSSDNIVGNYNCITANIKDNYWYLRSCTKRFYYVCEAPYGDIGNVD